MTKGAASLGDGRDLAPRRTVRSAAFTRVAALGAVAGVLLVPDAAFAHAPIQGIGDFYSGMLHPWMVPPHVLALLGLGMFVGRGGPSILETTLAAFVLALASGLVASGCGVAGPSEVALLVVACVQGLMVASPLEPRRGLCAALAAVTSVLVALDSPVELPAGVATLRATVLTLGGTGIGATLALIYSAGLVDYLKAPWQRIGVRIVGSWIAAASILVLALAAAGTASPR